MDDMPLWMTDAIRNYWLDGSSAYSVQSYLKSKWQVGRPILRAHPDYGKPIVDLDNKSWFDSMGNYGGGRHNTDERLFSNYA
jgi:hypothetical protein